MSDWGFRKGKRVQNGGFVPPPPIVIIQALLSLIVAIKRDSAYYSVRCTWKAGLNDESDAGKSPSLKRTTRERRDASPGREFENFVGDRQRRVHVERTRPFLVRGFRPIDKPLAEWLPRTPHSSGFLGFENGCINFSWQWGNGGPSKMK